MGVVYNWVYVFIIMISLFYYLLSDHDRFQDFTVLKSLTVTPCAINATTMLKLFSSGKY